MAHVRFLGLTSGGALPYFDAAADLFQAEYAARAGGYCAARVALYRAISYFKLAHIGAVVKRPPDAKDIVDRLLLEALKELSGEHNDTERKNHKARTSGDPGFIARRRRGRTRRPHPQRSRRDQTGGRISGAKVRLLNTATNQHADAITNEAGHFELPAQPLADYILSVKSKGFEANQLRFAPGKIPSAPVRIIMELAGTTESVQVTGGADTASATDTLASVESMNTFSGTCL